MSDNTLSESQRRIASHAGKRGRPYLKAGVFLFLAVLAGWAIGAGSAILYFKNKMHRVPPKPDAIAEAIIANMHKLFTLQGDESVRLKAIIDRRMTEVETIRKNSFGEIRRVMRGMDDELGVILGPERHKLLTEEREKSRPHKRWANEEKYKDKDKK